MTADEILRHNRKVERHRRIMNLARWLGFRLGSRGEVACWLCDYHHPRVWDCRLPLW